MLRSIGRLPSGVGALVRRSVRHAAVGAVAAALVVGGAMPFVGTVGNAAAQDVAFEAGSGRATAQLLRVGPSRGSLSLAPSFGLTLSDFLNTRGRGEARTAEFGALGDSLPPELVGQFPSVKVESTDEDSEAGRTISVGAQDGPGVAQLHAEAGAAPYGASQFRAAPIDLAAVVIDGARAESSSGVQDGRVRNATGVVRIGTLDIGDGALVLEGLEWRAVHRTGAESVEQATFTVGVVTVAGQRMPAPEGAEQPLADAIAAAQPLLGPLGIQVTLPQARIAGGIVEISPLRVRLADSELGQVAGPVLGAAQPARDALIDAVRSGSEDADAAILVADVALGVVAGGSRLDLEIGGVVAQTAEPAERFSFGAFGGGFDLSPPPANTGDAAPALSTGAAARPGSGSLGASSSIGGTGTQSSAAAASPIPGTGNGGGPLAVMPAGSSGGSGGAGPLLPIGLAAFAAAILAGLADYQRVRRQPVPSAVVMS